MRKRVVDAPAGSGDYLLGPQASAPSPMLWGIKVVPSPNLAPGTAIVGQFSAATLYVREQMTIAWAETGDGPGGKDLFGTNAVRARAEVRCLLAVHVGAAFAEVDLAA